MANTSLAQQLQKLQAPTTLASLDTREKASLLYDAKEAAKKDRRTIFELGISGLRELCTINPSFQQFEQTLFHENSIELERVVEQSEVNDLLNANINKFLQHLSPYFLLRPAHLCIEWLLRRFYVHAFNTQALLALALPYHETNISVRLIQTFPKKGAGAWLHVVKKTGLPLAKSSIHNRAASERSFLHFICEHTQQTVQEFREQASLLQALLNFYATTVIGALEVSQTPQEWHVNAILPSLLSFFNSEVPDVVSAAYMVTTQLVSRMKITLKLGNALIKRVSTMRVESLRSIAVLLLNLIFVTQQHVPLEFTDAVLLMLIKERWLCQIIAEYFNDKYDILDLCIVLLKQSVIEIQNGHSESIHFKLFLQRFLYDVKLSIPAAQKFITTFLDCLNVDFETIDLEFQDWYKDYLKQLEHQYPTAFDLAVKEALAACNSMIEDEAGQRSQAIKLALGFRLKSFDQNDTDIYERLYHPTAKIRLFAVQTLLKNLSACSEDVHNYTALQQCLVDRVYDDSEEVVAEVLKLKTNEFIKILGTSKFVQSLHNILLKAQVNPGSNSAALLPQVVKHLVAESIVENYDINLLLLVLMPVLLPKDESKACQYCLDLLVNSKLSQKIPLIKNLKPKQMCLENTQTFKRQFLDILSENTGNFDLFSSVQKLLEDQPDYFQIPLNYTHYLLLLTATLKVNLTAEESLAIYQHTTQLAMKFQLKHVDNQYWKNADLLTHIVPLQLYCDFLLTLVKRTEFKKLNEQDWTSESLELVCFLQIFQYMTEKMLEIQKSTPAKTVWLNTLQQLFETVLPDVQQKFEFLLNFCVYKQLKNMQNFAILRVFAFKLLKAVMESKNNTKLKITLKHILKINSTLQDKSMTLRKLALLTLQQLHDLKGLNTALKCYIALIIERQEEISMDEEQFALINYVILKADNAGKKTLKDTINICLNTNLQLEATFVWSILESLKHYDAAHILLDFIPLALNVLKHTVVEDGVELLKTPYSNIFELICMRLNNKQHLSSLMQTNEQQAWFFAAAFEQYKTFFISSDSAKLLPLPCVVLQQFDADIYESLSEKHKYDLIKVIIKTVAAANNDVIFITALKFLKKCELDCAAFVTILQQMFKKEPALCTESVNWKEGMVLLELLENRKRLKNVERIIPSLFDLLCVSLQADAGEGTLEYSKQLTLAALLNCCQKAKSLELNLPNLLPESSFRVDQVVQCVRTTKNPQTLHKALMLLTYCADLYPQQVLNNIMEIFTFMGSSVVRNDDAFSFKIICQIIETVIPILLQSTANAKLMQVQQETVIPMLKMFVYILFDVPEHRRLPLYTKLLNTLGTDEYLWIFLCILFEKLTANEEQKKRQQGAEKMDELNKFMEISQSLVNAFPAHTILETCIHLLHYVTNLPNSSEDASNSKSGNLFKAEQAEKCLFDLKTHSSKQLRHYKYVIMQFLSSMTNSADFLQKISQLKEQEVADLKPYYQNMIIETLTFVPFVNVAIEQSEETVITKFWKVILHHLHDILDNIISILSVDMFVVVVNGMLQHQFPSIRRKVLELLINKLQHSENFVTSCDSKKLHMLLQTLCASVQTILESEVNNSTHELAYIQQAQLIALKLLSRRVSLTYLSDFKNLLVQLIQLLKERKRLAKLLPGTVYLTTIEVAANLKAHCLPQLPKFMPLIVEVLQEQVDHLQNNPPEHMTVAAISGLQKLFESLPLFLGPYLVSIMTWLSTLHIRVRAHVEENTQATQAVTQKLTQIWSKMATQVPVRILVPSCEKAYKKLLEIERYAEVPVLMQMLCESITNTKTTDLATLQTEFSNLFLQTISYRVILVDTNLSREKISSYESPILDALVAWVLKLSESYFRLYYQRIHKWAFKDVATSESQLTYFLLTLKISDALKSLFVLFANDFIDETANILKSYTAENNDNGEELLQTIVKVLNNVFLHDSKTFINAHRFELLMQPLVDLLELNILAQHAERQTLLNNCLCHLAMVSPSDVHRKELVYQVLLKTRSNSATTQIWAFSCCVQIARSLGEDFRSLLPEVIPFIAELFEDDDPEVEKSVRKQVQQLEVILGESLQKYL